MLGLVPLAKPHETMWKGLVEFSIHSVCVTARNIELGKSAAFIEMQTNLLFFWGKMSPHLWEVLHWKCKLEK